MADVIGPCSTMPGHRHRVPQGQTCDDHPGVPAVARIQGETDSFGAELNDFCQHCLDMHELAVAQEADELNCCEWCGATNVKTQLTRDMDEGMSGPVYDVCGECIRKQNAAAAEELAMSDDADDVYEAYVHSSDEDDPQDDDVVGDQFDRDENYGNMDYTKIDDTREND